MHAGVRVLVFCVCNVLLNAAGVASLPKITLKGDVCARSGHVWVPWLTVPIEQLTILHFPADASLGRCDIVIDNHRSPHTKLSTSHGTPCGFGMIKSSLAERFESIDMCSANDEARVYEYDAVNSMVAIVFVLNDIKTNPEFSVFITPMWMCDPGDTNVSCCYDKYEKIWSKEDMPWLEYAEDTKNFTMLCDGQYCVEEAFMCDGVEFCADGKDEGEVCGHRGVANDGRVDCVTAAWVMVATSALVFTP